MGDARTGRLAGALPVDEDAAEARVPRRAGREVDLEGQPPVGEGARARAVAGPEDEGAPEVAVHVGRGQGRVRLVPLRRHAAAARDAARLDLEDVGEVAPDRHLEVEPDPGGAVVGEVEVLVHAFARDVAQHRGERARQDRAVLAEDLAVG